MKMQVMIKNKTRVIRPSETSGPNPVVIKKYLTKGVCARPNVYKGNLL